LTVVQVKYIKISREFNTGMEREMEDVEKSKTPVILIIFFLTTGKYNIIYAYNKR